MTKNPLTNLNRFNKAKEFQDPWFIFRIPSSIKWDAPWQQYSKIPLGGIPETSKEPTVKNKNIEIQLESIQNIFNQKFIGKKKVEVEGGKKDKLYFTYDVKGNWTFLDTHRTPFQGTTQDCIMVMKDRETTACSVGLLIELVEQSSPSATFPDTEHSQKIVRDMIVMHGKRSFRGQVYAVVTNLAQIIVLKLEGNDENNLVLFKSPVYTDETVRLVMEMFVSATPEQLGKYHDVHRN